MRRWRRPNRFWSVPCPGEPGRARLLLEELEGREVLAPIVTAPTFMSLPQMGEGGAITFSGDPELSGDAFAISAPYFDTLDATLSTPHGTITVDESYASSLGVTVAGGGTPSVSLSGLSDSVNAVIQNGFTFTDTPFYSGDAPITLFVRDRADGTSDAGSFTLHVLPDAMFAALSWDAGTELRLRTEPFPFPPGFLSVDPGFDPDGSETLTVRITVSTDDPAAAGGFKLLGSGGIVSAGAGQWTLTGTDPGAVQALFDSLVLEPPSGFSGRVTVTASGGLVDEAYYPSDGSTASDGFPVYSDSVDLRFFADAVIDAPPVNVPQGTVAVDLGGRYTVSDPAELPGDTHTLTIVAPGGVLSFNPAAVASGLSATVSGGVLVLSGELADINQFLGTPGSLTYTIGDPLFSGVVPVTLILQNEPEAPDSQDGSDESGSVVSDDPPPTVAVSAVSFGGPVPGGIPAPGAAPGGTGGPGAPAAPPPRGTTQTAATGYGSPSGGGGPAGQGGLLGTAGPEGREGHEGRDGAEGRDGRDGHEDRDGRPDARGPEGRTTFAGAGDGPRDGPGNGPRGPADHRDGSGPTQTQPFTRLDAQPLYTGEGGRHPLPPVLPLDQSLPVAGFSESAGDSLGLVDMIYRDAAGPEYLVLVAHVGPGHQAPAAPPPRAAPVTEPPAAVSPEPPPPGDEAPGPAGPTGDYAYAAVAVLAAGAGWLSRGYVARLARTARRWFRIPYRHPTQGGT